MPDDLEIPATALAAKANYAERPHSDIVREIKEFIKQTGTPHLWHGHTHTRPPQDATILYLGEFDLPASHSGRTNRAKWAPCPCCKPRTPWYYKNGRIAWFPEEKIIRIIGGDCFKSINEKGHAEAEALFRAEERRRRAEEYLLASLQFVPSALSAVEHNVPIIADIDRVRFILSERLTSTIDFDLWAHVRADGALKRQVSRTEHRIDRAGNERVVTVHDEVRYGPLAGYELVKANVKPMAERIEALARRLRPLNFGEGYVHSLSTMNDSERSKAIKALRSISEISNIIQEAEDIRQMLSPLSLGSLNGWSASEGAPAKIYIAFSDDYTQLHIGKRKEDARSMTFKPIFFSTLRKLPALSRSIRDVQ